MKRFLSLLALLSFLGSAQLLMAQAAGTGLPQAQKVKERISRQTRDIDGGVKSHMISTAEAKKYRAKLKTIQKLFNQYTRKNGRKKDLSPEQTKKLLEMLHENNSAIQGGDIKEETEPPQTAPGQ